MNDKKITEIRAEIMKRAAKESKPLEAKIKDIQGRIDTLRGREESEAQRKKTLTQKIGQLRDKALSALKGGGDPLPNMREAVQAEADLEALSELPELTQEAVAELEQERDKAMLDLYHVLGKATAEVRREQNAEFTRKLAGLLEDQEAWREAVGSVNVCGVVPYQAPITNEGGVRPGNDGILNLACLHGGVKYRLEHLIMRSHPEPNYKID